MTKRVNELRKKLGQRCFKAVLSEGTSAAADRMTKKRAGELAREYKRKRATLKATTDGILDVSEILHERRRVAGYRRRRGIGGNARLTTGRDWNYTKQSYYPRGYVFPAGTITERAHKRRAADVSRHAGHCLTSYARQSGTRVHVAEEFGKTGCDVHKTEGWIEYSRRFGSKPGITDAYYTIVVQKHWIFLPGWLKSCDGLLTLAAIRCPDDEADGETVYRARWARSGQGEPVVTEGYIVRAEREGRTYTAHGKTLGAARSSITRQQPEWVAAANERERKRAERIERCKSKVLKSLESGKLNGYEVPVTISDSRRAGNCPDGTAGWIDRHFPGREEAMVSEIIDVSDQHERVLLACVAAIRRQRPEVFA